MRRLIKFLHTIGAIGFMGAIACLLVLLGLTPAPTSLAEYVTMRGAMDGVATSIFLPSLGLTLIAGLLAMAANRTYQNAGWAWIKLVSGLLIFEWSLAAIREPMKQEAELGAHALARQTDPAMLGISLGNERISLWIMLAIATANVILGIWRPRLTRLTR